MTQTIDPCCIACAIFHDLLSSGVCVAIHVRTPGSKATVFVANSRGIGTLGSNLFVFAPGRFESRRWLSPATAICFHFVNEGISFTFSAIMFSIDNGILLRRVLPASPLYSEGCAFSVSSQAIPRAFSKSVIASLWVSHGFSLIQDFSILLITYSLRTPALNAFFILGNSLFSHPLPLLLGPSGAIFPTSRLFSFLLCWIEMNFPG